jgi:hypothetical protein
MTKPSKQKADSGAPEVSEKLRSDFFVPILTTGTVDEDDDPAGERADENEASVREKNENTEAADEFQQPTKTATPLTNE